MKKPTNRKSNGKKSGTDEAMVPANASAERAVLGAILLDNQVFSQAAAVLQPEDFHLDSHRKIYRSMMELARNGRPIDFVTIPEQLGDHDAKNVGGNGYITSLTDGLPRVKNISEYVRIVKEKAVLRGIQKLGGSMEKLAIASDAKHIEVLRTIESEIAKLKLASYERPTEFAGDGAALLAEVAAYIRRYMVVSESQAIVLAVWVFHTHCIDAAEFTPYIAVMSAEMRCGKSRLMADILRPIARNGWYTSGTTAANLYRKIDSDMPTAFLDEIDTKFGKGNDYAEGLREVLNSGYKRSTGFHSACIGQGTEIVTKDFVTFCPKMIAGIGNLPETVEDRCFPIYVKRKSREEKVSRFVWRDVKDEVASLHDRVAAWAAAHIEELRVARPDLPDQLNDRQQEVSEPPLAIVDQIGSGWGQRVRMAIVELCGESESQETIGVQLLADIRSIYLDRKVMSSEGLVAALNTMSEHPWCGFRGDKGIDQRGLAGLLKRYKIKSRTVRILDQTPRGYHRDDFEDAWSRYLPLIEAQQAQQAQQVNNDAGSGVAVFEHVADVRPQHVNGDMAHVADVALQHKKKRGSESSTKTRVVAHVVDVADGATLKTNGREHLFCYKHPENKRNWWLRPDGSSTCGLCVPAPAPESEYTEECAS